MKPCWHCSEGIHTRCTGGAWDDEYKPLVCSCWALDNHSTTPTKKKAKR